MEQQFHAYFFHQEEVKNQINQSHRIKVQTLLTFRIVALLYQTCVLVDLNLYTETYTTNFIYMTLWGAYLAYAYFLLSIIENVTYLMNSNKQAYLSPIFN